MSSLTTRLWQIKLSKSFIYIVLHFEMNRLQRAFLKFWTCDLYWLFYFLQKHPTYHWDHPARTDTATKAHPPLVVRILSPSHEVLVAHEVGSFIDHEAATLHPDGVAAAEVRVKVCAVIAALIAPTLEVFVLVKDNLVENKSTKWQTVVGLTEV